MSGSGMSYETGSDESSYGSDESFEFNFDLEAEPTFVAMCTAHDDGSIGWEQVAGGLFECHCKCVNNFVLLN